MKRKQSRKLHKKDIKKNSFILDILIGMGIGIAIVIVIIVLVSAINDLIKGSIPLESLINTIEWIIK